MNIPCATDIRFPHFCIALPRVSHVCRATSPAFALRGRPVLRSRGDKSLIAIPLRAYKLDQGRRRSRARKWEDMGQFCEQECTGRDGARAPATIRSVATDDVQEQADGLAEWDQHYVQLSAGKFNGAVTEIRFLDTQIYEERTDQSVRMTGEGIPGARNFTIPFGLYGTGSFHGHPLADEALLTFAYGDSLECRTPRVMHLVGVSFDMGTLAEYLECTSGVDMAYRLIGKHAIPADRQAVADARRLIQSMIATLTAEPHLLLDEPLQYTLRNALLDSIATLLTVSGDPLPVPASYSVRRNIVERAKEYVMANIGEAVTVADLCRAAGVSRRNLEYCFTEVLALSPAQFLRTVRLNGVRHELRQEASANVQNVAARWGFWHMSRFAQSYHAMFGELPSMTLRGSGTVRRGA
ncbi:MAG: helix-turn-helix domain-containing protein [Cupriavidus sp.]|nr:helix-turn-helix domain-containing protein [Cupriavidus sp.]